MEYTKDMTRQESLEKLASLVDDIEFAMLTTVDHDGSLRSRPMGTQKLERSTGTLWFFTSDDSPKSGEIHDDARVNVVYAKPDEHRYVSISGHGEITRDADKLAELWKPTLKAWFPKGLEDPHIALLKVSIEKAEYWDVDTSRMTQLRGLLESLLTGERPQGLAENRKLNITPSH